MAVQKRRKSKATRDHRRSQWMKMDAPSTNPCPHCGEPRLSHRACPSCGQYGPKDSARKVLSKEASAS